MGGLRCSFCTLLFFYFNPFNPFFPFGEGLPSPYPLRQQCLGAVAGRLEGFGGRSGLNPTSPLGMGGLESFFC